MPLRARLGEPEPAWEHLRHLVLDFATDSLLDLHPPRIFQIDGNFGGAAGVSSQTGFAAVSPPPSR